MPRLPWSPQDDARLTEIWKDLAPLKTHLDKFPGRSERALAERGTVLKLPDRRGVASVWRGEVTFARIKSLLKARPSTREELAARACVSLSTVRHFTETHRADIHVLRYRPRGENGYAAAVWTWGAGEDAPRPKAKLPKEIALAYDRRIRRDPFYRSKHAARARIRYAMKIGRFVRRDPAAVALFGPAVPDDDGGA